MWLRRNWFIVALVLLFIGGAVVGALFLFDPKLFETQDEAYITPTQNTSQDDLNIKPTQARPHTNLSSQFTLTHKLGASDMESKSIIESIAVQDTGFIAVATKLELGMFEYQEGKYKFNGKTDLPERDTMKVVNMSLSPSTNDSRRKLYLVISMGTRNEEKGTNPFLIHTYSYQSKSSLTFLSTLEHPYYTHHSVSPEQGTLGSRMQIVVKPNPVNASGASIYLYVNGSPYPGSFIGGSIFEYVLADEKWNLTFEIQDARLGYIEQATDTKLVDDGKTTNYRSTLEIDPSYWTSTFGCAFQWTKDANGKEILLVANPRNEDRVYIEQQPDGSWIIREASFPGLYAPSPGGYVQIYRKRNGIWTQMNGKNFVDRYTKPFDLPDTKDSSSPVYNQINVAYHKKKIYMSHGQDPQAIYVWNESQTNQHIVIKPGLLSQSLKTKDFPVMEWFFTNFLFRENDLVVSTPCVGCEKNSPNLIHFKLDENGAWTAVKTFKSPEKNSGQIQRTSYAQWMGIWSLYDVQYLIVLDPFASSGPSIAIFGRSIN